MIDEVSEILTILGVAIALSAYLSAYRIAAIQQIKRLSGESNAPARWEIKRQLGWLTLADAPMVTSALMLGTYVLWSQVWCGGQEPFPWLLPWGLRMFYCAAVAMVVLHVIAWVKTLTELYRGVR